MASLRARLLACLLVLAALGLLVAGSVTYAEQRSFLLDRVDQQAQNALLPLSHELDNRGFRPPPDSGPVTGGPGHGDGGAGGKGFGPPGGNDGSRPPGTYGRRRPAARKGRG